ncbi:XRE family transcriptional regulator [Pseudonocardiaceae bacterium YIM PH 21723]|nr:XRE family transcriptional regulator [Pseudonocardiaceae bacterium YIM PH 21723]
MSKEHNGSAGFSPTIRRRRLGIELRKLREAANLTGYEVAKELAWSHSKVSRIETGSVTIMPGNVLELLDLYAVPQNERAPLVDLARQSKQKGWWRQYDDVLPDWFDDFLGLESEAVKVSSYENELVPGLLQTEDYARAVFSGDPLPDSPDEIDSKVALRLARQRRLSGREAVKFHTVLNEAVIRRPVGGAEIMRAQLSFLAEQAKKRNVRIQVLPFSAGMHAAINGPFHILEFPDDHPKVVYMDQLTSSIYLDKLKESGRYTVALSKAADAALSTDDTIALLEKTAAEF